MVAAGEAFEGEGERPAKGILGRGECEEGLEREMSPDRERGGRKEVALPPPPPCMAATGRGERERERGERKGERGGQIWVGGRWSSRRQRVTLAAAHGGRRRGSSF